MQRSDHREISSLDRLLLRAIAVVAALLVLALLLLGAAYYRDRYYHPTVGVVDRDTLAVEEQIRREPEAIGPRVAAAYLYLEKGRPDDAIAQAEAILQVVPEHFAASQALGMAYLAKNDRARATAIFERLVAQNRDNPMANVSRQLASLHFYLGHVYLEDGRLDEAIVELRAASAADGSNADALRLLGDALRVSGDSPGAIVAYQRAVRLVPNFREAYMGLAEAYDNSDNLLASRYARAMAAYAAGAHDEAITQLESLASTWSDRPELHLGFALVYEAKGQPDLALLEYGEALRLAPDSIAARQGESRLRRDQSSGSPGR